MCSSDLLLADSITVNARADGDADERAFKDASAIIETLDVESAVMLARAFAAFFHLANICEEDYRVRSLRAREAAVPTIADEDPVNDITVAYRRLVEECGQDEASALLGRLEFHPVFTAHPTEARRKAVEGKIRRISALLEERAQASGIALAENERRMLQEIDALLRTSPEAQVAECAFP